MIDYTEHIVHGYLHFFLFLPKKKSYIKLTQTFDDKIKKNVV